LEKEIKKETNLLAENIMFLWKKKFWIIPATIILSLVFIVALFLNHKNGKKIESNFEIAFLNIENKQYPDASPFSYQDIISSELLERTKNSNKVLFENIDTEKIKRNNGITIRKISNKDEKAVDDSFEYNISFDIKHANNDIFVAEKFLESLKGEYLNFIKEKNKNNLINYHESIFNNYKNLAYHDLFEKIDFFYDVFDNYLNFLGKSNVFSRFSNETNLFNHFLVSLKNEHKVNLLESEYLSKNFVSKKDEVLFEEINGAIEKEFNYNKELLTELKATYNILSASPDSLVDSALLTSINDLTIKIEELKDKQKYFKSNNHSVNASYSAKIDNLVNNLLKDYEKEFNDFYLNLLNKTSNLSSTSNYSIASPFNLVFFATGVLFLTFFGVVAVFLSYNWFINCDINNKIKKETV